MHRKFLAVFVIALCAVSIGAQAMGVNVHGYVLAHPDVFASLSALALVGDTQQFNPTEIKAALDKITDQVKEHGEKILAEAGKISQANKDRIDELLGKQGELRAQLQHAEQAIAKLETNGPGGAAQPQSLGRQFIESDQWKAFKGQASPRGRVDLVVQAAITSVTTDTDGAAGDLVRSTRVPGVLELPQRRMTVRDLISPGRMDGNTLEYVKETGFTNNAAPVAEGAAKPESTLKFDLVTTTAKVIAHWMKASRQILDDASQLASVIDNRLRYGLAYVEEQQLLNGDGTGQNLLGIIPQATAYAAPFDPAGTETNIDFIRLAMLQSELALFPATGTVMHPSDWARIELLKDTTGAYIIGNPQGAIAPTLWNRPVVTTPAITVDKFLVGAYRMGAQVFDRWLARVEVSTEDQDNFIKNMVTILAEERLALAVYRPQAFIYGDFGNVA